MNPQNSVTWKTGTAAVTVGLVLLLLAFVLVAPAQATEFISADNAVLAAGEVVDDDLFIGGQTVTINGDVTGDLIATGTNVTVNGNVGGSLVIAGQFLEVNGNVAGSVYGGGFATTLGPEASIGRNVYYGGFSLEADPGSTVGRSLYAGGYQVDLNGEVADNVAVGTAALALNGSVGGDLDAQVGDANQAGAPFLPPIPGSEQVTMLQPGFTEGPDAAVGGATNIEVSQGTARARENQNRSFGLASAVTARVGEFIAILIIGGLLLWLWPLVVQESTNELQTRPLPSAGAGCIVALVFAILVPLAGIAIFVLALLLGFVTFGQLFGEVLGLGWASLALIVAAFGFVATLLTKVIVSYLVGRAILSRLSPAESPGFGRKFLALAIGALLYEIVRAIPFLGWIVAVVVVFIGLGAIYFYVRDRMRPAAPEQQKEPQPEMA